MNITYELLINMVAVGKMTREQLIKKLGISRSTYYRLLSKFSEENRQHLKALVLQNQQDSSIKQYYLDVSFREIYGEYTAGRYFIGKGRVFETEPKSELINVQDISIRELYENKERFVIVCSSLSKAELFKSAGFKNILLYQKQNTYYLLKGKRKAFV